LSLQVPLLLAVPLSFAQLTTANKVVSRAVNKTNNRLVRTLPPSLDSAGRYRRVGRTDPSPTPP
jgi:hypothetical protein